MEKYIPSSLGRSRQTSPSKPFSDPRTKQLRDTLAHLREENQNYQKEKRILNQSIKEISTDNQKLELAIADRLKEIEKLKRNNKLVENELKSIQSNNIKEKADYEDSEKSYNEKKEDKRSVTNISRRLNVFREMATNYKSANRKLEKIKDIQKYENLFHRLIKINQELTNQAQILLNGNKNSNFAVSYCRSPAQARSNNSYRIDSSLNKSNCNKVENTEDIFFNIDDSSRRSSSRSPTSNTLKKKSISNIYIGLLTGLGQKLKQNYRVIQAIPKSSNFLTSTGVTSHSSLRPSFFNQDNNSTTSPKSQMNFGSFLFKCNDNINDDFNFGINDERYTKANIDKLIRDKERELRMNYDFRDLEILIQRFERFKEGNQKRALARAKKNKAQLRMAGKVNDVNINENEIDNDKVHADLNDYYSEENEANPPIKDDKTKIVNNKKIIFDNTHNTPDCNSKNVSESSKRQIRFSTDRTVSSPTIASNNSSSKKNIFNNPSVPLKKQLLKKNSPKLEKDKPAQIINECRNILQNLSSKPPPDSTNFPPTMEISLQGDSSGDASVDLQSIVQNIAQVVSGTQVSNVPENDNQPTNADEPSTPTATTKSETDEAETDAVKSPKFLLSPSQNESDGPLISMTSGTRPPQEQPEKMQQLTLEIEEEEEDVENEPEKDIHTTDTKGKSDDKEKIKEANENNSDDDKFKIEDSDDDIITIDSKSSNKDKGSNAEKIDDMNKSSSDIRLDDTDDSIPNVNSITVKNDDINKSSSDIKLDDIDDSTSNVNSSVRKNSSIKVSSSDLKIEDTEDSSPLSKLTDNTSDIKSQNNNENTENNDENTENNDENTENNNENTESNNENNEDENKNGEDINDNIDKDNEDENNDEINNQIVTNDDENSKNVKENSNEENNDDSKMGSDHAIGGASFRARLSSSRVTPTSAPLNIEEEESEYDDEPMLFTPRPPEEEPKPMNESPPPKIGRRVVIATPSPKSEPKVDDTTPSPQKVPEDKNYSDDEDDEINAGNESYPGYNQLKSGGKFSFSQHCFKNSMATRISRASLIASVNDLNCQVERLRGEIQMLENKLQLNDFERGIEAENKRRQQLNEEYEMEQERKKQREIELKNKRYTFFRNVDNYYIDMKRDELNFNQFKKDQASNKRKKSTATENDNIKQSGGNNIDIFYDNQNDVNNDIIDNDYYIDYVNYVRNDAAVNFDLKSTQTSVTKQDIEKIEKIQNLGLQLLKINQENDRLRKKYEIEKKKSKAASYIEVANKLKSSIENRRQIMRDGVFESIKYRDHLDKLQTKLNDEISKNELIREKTERILQRPKQSVTAMVRTINDLKSAESAIKRKMNSLRIEEENIDSKLSEIQQICNDDEIIEKKQEIKALKNNFKRNSEDNLSPVVELGEIERFKKMLDKTNKKIILLKQSEVDFDSKINNDLNELYKLASGVPSKYFKSSGANQNGNIVSSLSSNSNANAASDSNNLIFMPPIVSQFDQQNYSLNII